MIHKIFSVIGLGILGIDPMTAILILSMNLKNDKKTKISLFAFSFMFFSIIIGVLISLVFGVTVVDYIKSLIPNDNSNFWLILELILLIIIFFWIFKRFTKKNNTQKTKEKEISGTNFEYVLAGFLFALTSFTDPTYYASIVLASETKNFLLSLLLIAIWFFISQFMAVITYIAGEFNFLDKVFAIKNKISKKYGKILNFIFNVILIVIAILLILDLCFYIFRGSYLF